MGKRTTSALERDSAEILISSKKEDDEEEDSLVALLSKANKIG